MTEIKIETDCGNSPKREFLKKFSVAMAQGDKEFLLKSVTEDISWVIIGDREIIGIDSYAKELDKIFTTDTRSLTLFQILSHGKEGAVNGKIESEDGDVIRFSEFFVFKGAKGDKIKSIVTYFIKVQ